jgi:branched-chain amino acid transport system ATP-binding protein
MLAASNVTVDFNGALALRDVNVTIPSGATTAVLGRNGAGKTTLLRALAGATRLARGTVRWDDRTVPRQPSRAAAMGLRFVPESGNVFPELSVLDNLRSGAPWLRPGELRRRVDEALEVLPLLGRLLPRRAAQLSGGERQALAIARALVAQPRLLLLDEPSLGLAPKLASELLSSLSGIVGRRGTTTVIAEQNVPLAVGICDHVIQLDTGAVTFAGPAAEFQHS